MVAGGGPAGLATALALAHDRIATVVMAPPHRPLGDKLDSRTAALLGGSIDLLRNLGAWDGCRAASAPLAAIRIVDDTGGWPRAPEVLFAARDAGLDAFGFNVPNTVLVEQLLAAARRTPLITLVETAAVTRLEADATAVTATTTEGRSVAAVLAVAADGSNSLGRDSAGIGVTRWSYDQAAVTAQFEHGRDHEGISTELHRPAGPLTVVPMPGRASSLVWVERPEVAARLATFDAEAFRAELEQRLGGLLGRIGAIGPRGMFPLSGLTADVFGRHRVALVGESAHVVPPIGAQGLNLGLRDAATIAEIAADAAAAGDDIGGPAVLDAYSRRRAADVRTRAFAVDLLNRSLLTPLVPVHLLRGLGLAALRSIAPLRRLVMREGIAPSAALPRLMRPPQTMVE